MSQVVLGRVLGKGTFGTTYIGEWRGGEVGLIVLLLSDLVVLLILGGKPSVIPSKLFVALLSILDVNR